MEFLFNLLIIIPQQLYLLVSHLYWTINLYQNTGTRHDLLLVTSGLARTGLCVPSGIPAPGRSFPRRTTHMAFAAARRPKATVTAHRTIEGWRMQGATHGHQVTASDCHLVAYPSTIQVCIAQTRAILSSPSQVSQGKNDTPGQRTASL